MARQDLIYLSDLAQEHSMHIRSYEALMSQYEGYLLKEYNCRLADFKGKSLPNWVVHLFRELNPTDFEINSMKEEGKFYEWLKWMGDIKKQCTTANTTES